MKMTYQIADLTGKVAFVTGGSSGIGAEVAKSLSAQGVKLALFSRSGKAPKLPDSLELCGDVGKRADVNAAVQQAVDTYGRLDIVVSNAGVGSYGQFVDVPTEHEDEMIRTNVMGTINLYHAAIPHMLTNGGDLVTLSSEAGRRGLPGEAVYSASKFAQVGLTRALDNELREFGIRATNICPGGIWTNFAVDDGRGRTDGSDQLKAMMRPQDIAELITFVLTRPRHLRILETALRPMSEASWG
jgi:3-oxoacyl-[acyl-carrier protein] reductase